MHLYNVTLQQTSCVVQAVVGNFTGSKKQQILLGRNTSIEMISADPNTGTIHSICEQDVFGIIRSLITFRLTGSKKDFIVLGTDSGSIAVLEYSEELNRFQKVQIQVFGKQGIRRTVPGQYLAADPSGRAVMVGAIERSKFVYILNRDSESKLTISSPLEAHKPNSVCFSIVALDVGYENPLFAAIEVEFEMETTEKNLIFYELDLGLNHVVRKWSTAINRTANMLISIPGGVDGPGGVLVCSEGKISWHHENFTSISVNIPERSDPLIPEEMPLLICTSVVHKLKQGFFVLVQTERGDIFKLTMDYLSNADGTIGQVVNLRLKYFETLPVANSFCLLKAGFLFVASEMGNHQLYQIENLGDDDDEQPEFQSIEDDAMEIEQHFNPRPLRNLGLVDEMDSLMPMIDSVVANLSNDDSPQIYAICGKGARSTFRILKHGLQVSEIADSELPGNPCAVWTVRGDTSDEFDSYIVISFVNATLVLSIGETVEEVTDTGVLTSKPTLAMGQLGEDSLVQIYPGGIRHIRADKKVSEWKAPKGTFVICGTCNFKQVSIALTNFQIVYFELDQFGNLNEFEDRKNMSSEITSLAMSPIPEGRQRALFLAVGCEDNTVRVLSLAPSNCLESVSMQALSAPAHSLALTEMIDPTTSLTSLFLHMGLRNGVFLRTTIDNVTGLLTDVRQRFLGVKPVKLFPVKIAGASGVLALSSQPWLSYTYLSRTRVIPLSYENLEFGAPFCSADCPEGIVAITGNSLRLNLLTRILAVDKLSSVFNQVSYPLNFTPRKMLLNEKTKKFVVLEADHGTFCPSAKTSLLADHIDLETGEMKEELDPVMFGLPTAGPGNWGSCIRYIDPFNGETLSLITLDNNESVVSCCLCVFANYKNEQLLVVGTVKDRVLNPKSFSTCFVKIYRFVERGTRLEFFQETEIDEIPQALCPFQGKLLVGIGKILRIYDIGKKKLLRKCESRGFPKNIIKLQTQGDRIYATDATESVQFASYRHFDNRIVIFADDPIPRFMTCSTVLDYDTMAGGDKFGTVFVERMDDETAKTIKEDKTGNLAMYERGFLQGAPHKLTTVASIFVGETITSIQRVQLIAGGNETIVYSTLMGTVGVLIPFTSKSDFEFFQLLEITLRDELPPLSGRMHLLFRGSFSPVNNTIDGDLCELYNQLPNEKKRAIAESLDRTVAEVAKKLDDIRNTVAF